MASHFYRLKVADVRAETGSCVSVAFEVPDLLKEVFDYKAGQYITLRAQIDGEEVRRSYSICSSPEQGELRIAVKRVVNGKFSMFVNDTLKVSDTLEVMPPAGRFFAALEPSNKKMYVMIAAGSGITPVIALVKSILRNEPLSRVVLLYSNKTRADIIFKEELAGLKNQYMDRLLVLYFFTKEELEALLYEGRLTAGKLQRVLQTIVKPHQPDEVFICGPEAMMLHLRASLLNSGLGKKQVHIELFGAAKKEASAPSNKATFVEQPADSYAQVKVKIDGAAIQFKLHSKGESILEAALQRGADLPFACKGGVCTTCRAWLEEGEVEMDVNYGLEPEEVAAGFILTCQSHPKTPTLVVNYDAR